MTAKLKNTFLIAWWYGRTKLEKTLFIVTTAVVLGCLGLSTALAVIATTWYERDGDNGQAQGFMTGRTDDNNVCLTKGCVVAAATLIRNMDENVNPCEDFFQYACGGFMDRTVIPDDKTSITSFVVLEEDLKQRLKVLIEQPKNNEEPESFWKIKDLYGACMNTSQIQEVGSKPLVDLINSVGGWPAVLGNSWNEENFNWVSTLYSFREVGITIDYLFDLSVSKDLKNTTYRLIELDQPVFGMPDRAYLLKGFNDSLVQAYYNLMINVAVLLGANKADAHEQLKESLQFETQLANFSLPREERRNYTKLYHKMTVSDLYQLSSHVNWLEYFNTILPYEIESNEPVIVNVPAYITKALDFINNSPKRVVANYIMWRVALNNIGHLDKRFRAVRMEYVTTLTGQTQETARWLQCMSVSSSAMPVALGSMYVRQYFKQEAKVTALEMVDGIRDEFRKILDEVTWMDSGTKEKAQDKLSGITKHVAYPDELLNNRLLDGLYQNITITSDDHFANLMSIRRYAANFSYGLLRKPVNKTDWKNHGEAAEVNAYYNPPDNNFPAGILQGVFFASDRPRYLNYGGIGFVIGHEITHGFDDQGRQFDKDGNLKNWWDKATDIMFDKRVKCIIDQYSNYTVPENGMKVNGINTQGENIADNGGLKEAYRAYQTWSLKQGSEPLLPGLTLNQRQLFWLSAANVWCSKERPQALAVRVVTGVHSPSRFRVNGPMSNLPAFSEDFQCTKGSPMNPLNKCSVW
uniref:Peptidase M13 N-terminal domain-containing protein n=1 Tax=Strigamia maritima TaxID=126957 RepID=T1IPL6_STRMM